METEQRATVEVSRVALETIYSVAAFQFERINNGPRVVLTEDWLDMLGGAMTTVRRALDPESTLVYDRNGVHDGYVCHVNENIPGALYIGRAHHRKGLKASPFANPAKITPTMSRRDAIIRFEEHLVLSPELWKLLPSLRGQALACWCRRSDEEKTDETACHGDLLVALVTRYSDDELRHIGDA